jgi:hypothetical protein
MVAPDGLNRSTPCPILAEASLELSKIGKQTRKRVLKPLLICRDKDADVLCLLGPAVDFSILYSSSVSTPCAVGP